MLPCAGGHLCCTVHIGKPGRRDEATDKRCEFQIYFIMVQKVFSQDLKFMRLALFAFLQSMQGTQSYLMGPTGQMFIQATSVLTTKQIQLDSLLQEINMFVNTELASILTQCLMSIVNCALAVKFWAIDKFIVCKSSIHTALSFENSECLYLEGYFFHQYYPAVVFLAPLLMILSKIFLRSIR